MTERDAGCAPSYREKGLCDLESVGVSLSVGRIRFAKSRGPFLILLV